MNSVLANLMKLLPQINQTIGLLCSRLQVNYLSVAGGGGGVSLWREVPLEEILLVPSLYWTSELPDNPLGSPNPS